MTFNVVSGTQTLPDGFPQPDPFKWEIVFDDFTSGHPVLLDSAGGTSAYPNGHTQNRGWNIHTSTSAGCRVQLTTFVTSALFPNATNHYWGAGSFFMCKPGNDGNDSAAFSPSEGLSDVAATLLFPRPGKRVLIRAAFPAGQNDGAVSSIGVQAGLGPTAVSAFDQTSQRIMIRSDPADDAVYACMLKPGGSFFQTGEYNFTTDGDGGNTVVDVTALYDDNSGVLQCVVENRRTGVSKTLTPVRITDGSDYSTGLAPQFGFQPQFGGRQPCHLDYYYIAVER